MCFSQILGKVKPINFLFITVVSQDYNINVLPQNYVIKGNDAILKCEIPSFVADLIEVVSWVDNSAKDYAAKINNIMGKLSVTTLTLPLFLTPPKLLCSFTIYNSLYKTIDSGFVLTVVFQEFNINVPRETYAITGNDAIIKCEVPSFVADLVSVTGWTDSSDLANVQREILSGNN